MSSHNWYFADQQDENSFVISTWAQEGWRVEEDGGRFEVYYHTNERMRLGADGTLSFGRPEGYWFNTREWAELCVKRLNSLDRAFGRYAPGLTLDTSGNFGIGITSASNWAKSMFEIRQAAKPIVTMDQGGAITHLDLPALIGIWWRGTTTYRAWRKLMWGEKA